MRREMARADCGSTRSFPSVSVRFSRNARSASAANRCVSRASARLKWRTQNLNPLEDIAQGQEKREGNATALQSIPFQFDRSGAFRDGVDGRHLFFVTPALAPSPAPPKASTFLLPQLVLCKEAVHHRLWFRQKRRQSLHYWRDVKRAGVAVQWVRTWHGGC